MRRGVPRQEGAAGMKQLHHLLLWRLARPRPVALRSILLFVSDNLHSSIHSLAPSPRYLYLPALCPFLGSLHRRTPGLQPCC